MFEVAVGQIRLITHQTPRLLLNDEQTSGRRDTRDRMHVTNAYAVA